jgi:hypothetical protein
MYLAYSLLLGHPGGRAAFVMKSDRGGMPIPIVARYSLEAITNYYTFPYLYLRLSHQQARARFQSKTVSGRHHQ